MTSEQKLFLMTIDAILEFNNIASGIATSTSPVTLDLKYGELLGSLRAANVSVGDNERQAAQISKSLYAYPDTYHDVQFRKWLKSVKYQLSTFWK